MLSFVVPTWETVKVLLSSGVVKKESIFSGSGVTPTMIWFPCNRGKHIQVEDIVWHTAPAYHHENTPYLHETEYLSSRGESLVLYPCQVEVELELGYARITRY
jgi:hypothetical protein